MGELIERGNLRPTGTLEDFRSIHRVLFQDIYAWAGQVRTVEIRKNVDGAEFFLPSASIPMGMEWSCSELLGDNMLKGLGLLSFPNALRIITTTTTLSTRLERATAGRSVYFGRCSVTMPGTTWTGGLYPARRTTRPVDSLPRIGTTRCSLACSPGLPHRAIRRCPSIEGSWRPITCTKADATCPPGRLRPTRAWGIAHPRVAPGVMPLHLVKRLAWLRWRVRSKRARPPYRVSAFARRARRTWRSGRASGRVPLPSPPRLRLCRPAC